MQIEVGTDPGLQVTGILALVGTQAIYRASIKTPSTDSDEARCTFICNRIAEIAAKLPGAHWTVEDYEYQGARSKTKNAIRLPRLIGRIQGVLQALGVAHGMVTRNTWGRALGIKDDADQRVLLSNLTGLTPNNSHERDAACCAKYGQRAVRKAA